MRVSRSSPSCLSFAPHKTSDCYLSEMISQYSAVMFLTDSRQIVTRDLMSLKVWDIARNSAPLATLNVDEHISGHLCELF